MRKATLLFTGLMALAILAIETGTSRGEVRLAPVPDGFGKKVTGAYFVSFPIKALINLSADGGVAGETQESFGFFGGDSADRFASSYRGTWRRAGRRAIEMRLTRMNFAEDGTPLGFIDLRAHFEFTDLGLNEGAGQLEFQACDFDTWSPQNCDVVNEGTLPFEMVRVPLDG